ncbi:STAS domain-containing protein [Streptomyces virginiae]|uniref:STAS domain-containing protein n=1 Tax=Streptomyces virginiae TaxID=1961 RepID=UPI00368882B3
MSTDRTILTVSGELDMDAAPHLTEAADVLDLPGQAVALDLSDVTFIDSSGLNALLALRHRVNVAGERWK